MIKHLLFLGILLFFGVEVDAQRTTLSGKVTDYKEKGIKNVEIYIDMKRIKASTNRRGKYSFKFPSKFKLLTVYTPEYGFINWKYNGEKKIDFVFPKGNKAMTREDFTALGYSVPDPLKEYEKNFYANYSSILEILDYSFPQVQVKGSQIFISRRGVNAVLLEDPLILVNEIPTSISSLETIPTQEVKSIKVISKGSEAAAFGYRGMNGVILVNLKTSEDDS